MSKYLRLLDEGEKMGKDILAATDGEKAKKEEQKLLQTPKEKRKNIFKKTAVYASGLLFVAAVVCFIFFWLPFLKYQAAKSNYEKGAFDDAIQAFSELDDYQESKILWYEAMLAKAETLTEQGIVDSAVAVYEELEQSEIIAEQKLQVTYLKANALFDAERYQEALTIFETIEQYEDSQAFSIECNYQIALVEYEDEYFDQAYNSFIMLSEYKDSASKADECLLLQLKKVADETPGDNDLIKEWLSLAVKNSKASEDAHNIAKEILNREINAGQLDYAYTLITDTLAAHQEKYIEQGYSLAAGYINKTDYEKGRELLKLIASPEYKDAKDLMNECIYQVAAKAMESSPDSAVSDLYMVAAENYKDSRELLDSICTSEWLFDKLAFSNMQSIFVKKDILWFKGDSIFDFSIKEMYIYNVSFDTANLSFLPITGSIRVICQSADESTREKIVEINLVEPQGTGFYTAESFKYNKKSEITQILFEEITGNDGLKVFYAD